MYFNMLVYLLTCPRTNCVIETFGWKHCGFEIIYMHIHSVFYFNCLVPRSGGQVVTLLILVSVATETFLYDRFSLISPGPSFNLRVVGMGGIRWEIALGN